MVHISSMPAFQPKESSLKRRWLQAALIVAVVLASLMGARIVEAIEPLALPQAKEIYQRIITLPGAALRAGSAGAATGQPLPVFSIFYVFGRKTASGQEWVEVGRQLHGPSEGWLPADQTDDWTTMLVMQYAPAGQRGRTLYFERETDLADIVDAPDQKPIVERLTREADSGKPTDPPLVAIEPKVERGVPTFNNKPYLMPISGYKRISGRDAITLIEVASLNSEPPASPKPANPPTMPAMKVGIVFVIDTTISMQPYIERALQTIETVYAALQQEGALDRTSFGLVGYRNNMDQEPQRSGLEYVVRVYQDLDPSAPVDAILDHMRAMHEAKISTHSFDEDAIAGLYTAINQMNWEPFTARLIIFVTDAGALCGCDTKAKCPGVDILNIRESADRKKIAIFPIHLLSEAAAKVKNIEKARKQYLELGRTGDQNASKYIPVRGASPEDFQKGMQQLATAITSSMRTLAGNRPMPQVEDISDNPTVGDLGKLVVNELFNAQMRYIGAMRGTQAPVFFKSWASDKDLVNPSLKMLNVTVFLTRNQLNELALSLKHVVDQIKAASTSQASVFSLLRSLAAATTVNPDRYRANFHTIGESNLLPTYLNLLPYKSEILGMSEEVWKNLSKSEFEAQTDRLAYKLRVYQDIYQDTKNWRDLGAGDPGQEVYPVPLDYLP